MRIGVAGVGRIGTMHATNLASLATVDQVVVADGVEGRAKQVAAKLGVSAATDLDELLHRVDGVVVATPTNTHPAVLRTCLAARIPILCEKPIAGERHEMRHLIEDVEASGVPVVVGFQRRFDPAVVELKRRIDAGELGDVYLISSRAHDAEPPDPGYVASSGGIYRDLFIHDLDAVPWLVGAPVVKVYAVGSVLVDPAFAEADDVDTAAVTLTFANGAIAVLTGGRRNPCGYDHRIEVLGSRDSLAVGLDPRTPLTSLEPDGPPLAADVYPGFPERFHRAYVNEMAVFVDIVAGRAVNPSPVQDSVVSLELALAAERSRREGHAVTLTPVAAGGA
jgi:myo-inositol 2-dehydrogenase/D-chiro-inositol 1-dehydrogenase